MDTKICGMCKSEIPADAKKCAKCGSDQRSWVRRHPILTGIVSLFGFFVIMGVIGSANNGQNYPSQQIHKPSEASIAVTAVQLFAAYEANAIAADNQYKGKLLEVSGIVASVGKDILDAPYVSLKTNNPIFSVQCMIDKSEAAQAATLSKGARIVVVGRNSGKLGNILLRDCSIK